MLCVENNHNCVRDIILNDENLKKFTKKDLDLMFSHTNSTLCKSLNGKIIYKVFSFLWRIKFFKL